MTPTVEKPDVRIYCVRKAESKEISRIRAETVCEEGSRSATPGFTLTFKLEDNVVGKVHSMEQIDWWIEEEETGIPIA